MDLVAGFLAIIAGVLFFGSHLIHAANGRKRVGAIFWAAFSARALSVVAVILAYVAFLVDRVGGCG